MFIALLRNYIEILVVQFYNVLLVTKTKITIRNTIIRIKIVVKRYSCFKFILRFEFSEFDEFESVYYKTSNGNN